MNLDKRAAGKGSHGTSRLQQDLHLFLESLCILYTLFNITIDNNDEYHGFIFHADFHWFCGMFLFAIYHLVL